MASVESIKKADANPVCIGYELSTPCSNIVKLLDQLASALLTYGPHSAAIFEQILTADPDCFAAHVLISAFQLVNEVSSVDISKCEQLRAKYDSHLTEWEIDLYDVVCLLKKLKTRKAVHLLMEMVRKNPFDIISMILGYFVSLVLLDAFMMRDIVGRVLPFYSSKHPYRGLLEAHYGFALLETFSMQAAEKHIKSALEKNPLDAWPIHTNCHLLEFTGQYDEAIKFLEVSKAGYESNLSCHVNWHKAMFQLGVGDEDGAYKVFQDTILKLLKRPNDVADAASLLWRLRFEDYQVPNDDFQEIVKVYGEVNQAPLCGQLNGAFHSFNYASCFIGAQDTEGLSQFKELINGFMEEYKGTEVVRKFENVGNPMIEAMECYAEGDYETAANKAYEVRDGFQTGGGSEAQKDFFHYLLFYALKKQNFPEPKMKLTCLLNERSGYRTLAPILTKML